MATTPATIGEHLRRARIALEWRQEDVVERARLCGLPWTRWTVTSIENGRRELTGAELLLVPVVYEQSLKELLCGEAGIVLLTKTVAMPAGTLARLLDEAA